MREMSVPDRASQGRNAQESQQAKAGMARATRLMALSSLQKTPGLLTAWCLRGLRSMAASCQLLPTQPWRGLKCCWLLQASPGLRKSAVLLSIPIKYCSSASRSLSGCHSIYLCDCWGSCYETVQLCNCVLPEGLTACQVELSGAPRHAQLSLVTNQLGAGKLSPAMLRSSSTQGTAATFQEQGEISRCRAPEGFL